MGDLGYIALVGALALAVYAAGASLIGAWRLNGPLIASGRNAALGVTVLFTAASFTLLAAFVANDFSLRYVYDNSSRAMPMDMLMPAFYSGQRGSLLFWGWTLSIFTAIVLIQLRKPGAHSVFMPYVIAVLMLIEGFMALLLNVVGSPFERLPFTPPDGVGLNPLLYDEGMKIHPPMLLMGYMAWSVPFAFAVAALATGRLNSEWLRLSRRYALVAWTILGLGNLLGSWWAYRVLGWGGYWGWDPVENVALMPWLAGTAFIHSLQVQERRGMLKAWNVALILLTFYLSIFGTFVVRSGILASVHSFALSQIGPYFLGYLGFLIAGSVALFLWRLPRLREENHLDSAVSREGAFLLNNVLFLAVTFAIFWGTVYPLVAEALSNQKISVGVPYFNQVASPLFGALLLLMGIAPLVPWRKTTRAYLVRQFLPPVGTALLGTVAMLVAGMREPVPLVGFTICLFAGATVVVEFVRGVTARAHATGENLVLAFASLVRRNNRRYGGYTVHLAIALIGAGIVGSQAFQVQAQATLAPGQTMQVGAYSLTAQSLQTFPSAGGRTVEARLLVNGSGEAMRPQRVFFQNFDRQSSTRVAIRSTFREDLYIVLSAWDESGPVPKISIAAYVNPLVSWIWAGGLLFLIGSLAVMWPAPQPSVRTVRAAAPRGALVSA
ncbi:MAG: heme lyase CcmF/NrfE family subunit [Chloroflexi bacterium]|nr:heme lyase CcmF/NrfE family subunit [Chloroflexota bacterium]